MAYGILETVLRVSADDDSEWANQFKNGELEIKNIVPILDLNDEFSEVMLVFDKGTLIVNSQTGTLLQFSYGDSDLEYFNNIEALYVDGLQHFRVLDGIIIDGTYSNMEINDVKKQRNLDRTIEHKLNEKWDSLLDNSDLVQKVIQGYGANEGQSRHEYITDPNTWLINYYGSSKSVWYNKGYTKTVHEILQNASYYPEANDCALISTLEIISYFQTNLTQSQKNTAYNAMKNSSYFSSSNGVYWNDNNNLFKIAVEAIGSPWGTQDTSDDVEDLFGTKTYNYFYDALYNYGPGYISLNQDPYGAHTVTFKGIKQWIVDWTNSFGAYYSYIENFVMINDHWSATSGETYINLEGAGILWYVTNIVPN